MGFFTKIKGVFKRDPEPRPLVNNQKAKDRNFAQFFGESINAIGWLKLPAHFISGALAYFSLANFMDQSIPEQWAWAGGVTTVALALFTAWFIEKGTSDNLPIWLRQIVRWQFAGWPWIFMFLINTGKALMFVAASPVTTFLGSQLLVDKTKPEFEPVDRSALIAEYEARRDSLDSIYAMEIRVVDSLYDHLKAEAEAGLAGKIKAAKGQRYILNKAVEGGQTWRQRERDEARGMVNVVEGEAKAKVAEIEVARMAKRDIVEADKRAEEAKVERWYLAQNEIFDKEDEENRAQLERFGSGYNWVMVGIGLIAVFLIFLISLAREVYKMGGGKEDHVLEYEPSPNRFMRFALIMANHVGYRVDKLLNTLERALPDPEGSYTFNFKMPKFRNNLFHKPAPAIARHGDPGGGVGGDPGDGVGGVQKKAVGRKRKPVGGFQKKELEEKALEPKTELPTDLQPDEKELRGNVRVEELEDKKIPFFDHHTELSGNPTVVPYDKAGCLKQRSGWVSKNRKYRREIKQLNKKLDEYRAAGDDKNVAKWEKKVERKRKAINNSRYQKAYWERAAELLIAEEKRLGLV